MLTDPREGVPCSCGPGHALGGSAAALGLSQEQQALGWESPAPQQCRGSLISQSTSLTLVLHPLHRR